MIIIEDNEFYATGVSAKIIAKFIKAGFVVVKYDKQEGRFLRKGFTDFSGKFSGLLDYLDSSASSPQNVVVEICPDGTLQIVESDSCGNFSKLSTEDHEAWIKAASHAGVSIAKWEKELFSLDVKTDKGYINVGYNLPLTDVKKLASKHKNEQPLGSLRELGYRIYDKSDSLVLVSAVSYSGRLKWNKGVEKTRLEMAIFNHGEPKSCACEAQEAPNLTFSPLHGFVVKCASEDCPALVKSIYSEEAILRWNKQ